MRMSLKYAVVLLAVAMTGCNAIFQDAFLSSAGTVISDAISALITSLIPTAG